MLTFSKKAHHSFIIFLALIALPKSITPIDEKSAHSFHKRLTPAGDHLSIAYGYCALHSGIIEKIVAFAPDSTAVARLARILFFIGDDGKLVVTNNPVSATPQITPRLWAAIATILTNSKDSSLKTKDIGALIREGLAWDNQITNAEKIKKTIIDNNTLCKSLSQKIEQIEEAIEKIDPKKDPVAYENKRRELKTTNGALKQAIALLSDDEKRKIKAATREEKSPEKIARLLVDALDECSSSKKLWPINFAYVLISAFIAEKFTQKEIAEYLENLPAVFRQTGKEAFREDSLTTKVLLFFRDAKKIEVVPYISGVSVEGHTFPDCAENTVLNAINHLAYDPEKKIISLSKLSQNSLISINPAIIKYYQGFSTPTLQRDIAAHNAWATLLSKNKQLDYLQDKNCELSPDIRSILKALGHLIFYDPNTVASDTEVLEKLKQLYTVTFEDKKIVNDKIFQKLAISKAAPVPFFIISQMEPQPHAALIPQKTAANEKVFNTSAIIKNNNTLLLASVVPLLGQEIINKLPEPAFDLLIAISQETLNLLLIPTLWQSMSLENAGSILWRFAFKNPTVRDNAAFQNNFQDVFNFCRNARTMALFFENENNSLALQYTADPKIGFNYTRVSKLLTESIPVGLEHERDKETALRYVSDFIELLSAPQQLFSGKQIVNVQELIKKSGIPHTHTEKALLRLTTRELASLSFVKGEKTPETILSLYALPDKKSVDKIADLIKSETSASFKLRHAIQKILQSSESLNTKKTDLENLIKTTLDLAWPYTNSAAFIASLILAIINANHTEWLSQLPDGDALIDRLTKSEFVAPEPRGKAEKR